MPVLTCPTHDAAVYRDEETLRCTVGNEIIKTRRSGSYGQSAVTSPLCEVSHADDD